MSVESSDLEDLSSAQASILADLPFLTNISDLTFGPIADDLNAIRDQLTQAGQPIYNFNQGLVRPPQNWTKLTRQWLKEGADIFEPWSMSRVAGLQPLRATIAKWRQELWREEIYDKNILITLGANVAWNLVLKTISNEGDKIAITRPYFFNHHGSIVRNARTPKYIELDFEAEVESLERNCMPVLAEEKVRAFLISNPHNPTGTHFPRYVLNDIEEGCSELKKWLVLDESYGALEQRDLDFKSSGQGLNMSTTILIGSLTKSLALGDIRVGYIIAHEAVIQNLKALADDEYICVSQIMQYAAIKAVENRSIVQGKIDDELRAKTLRLEDLLRGYKNLDLAGGNSSVFAWIKLPSQVDDILMVEKLAQESGVLITAGSHYGAPGHIRIGYGMCRNILEIDIIINHIKNYVETNQGNKKLRSKIPPALTV